MYRSYQEDIRRLTDLCRCALVFTTVTDLTACLRAIAADDTLIVIRMGHEKQRLREDFDAEVGMRAGRTGEIRMRLRSDTRAHIPAQTPRSTLLPTAPNSCCQLAIEMCNYPWR